MHTGAQRDDARSNAARCDGRPTHGTPPYGLELRQLRYLVILSEERNMTRAAVRLHLTQPALSQALNNLELRLGVRMFERVPRGVELTGTGEEFISYARTAVAAADAAEAAAARLVAQRHNQVVIAFTTGLMSVASRLVCCLRREDKALEINMKHTSTKTLVQGLTAGTVDLGLSCPELRVPGVKTTPALPSSLVALMSSDHALAAQSTVSVEQLLGTDLVGPWAQELIQRAATIADIAESEASDEDELASIEQAWPDILVGKAVAVVPSFVAAPFTVAGVIAVDLADHPQTSVGISRRADDPRPLTRTAHQLLGGVAAA
jgi:DNA-binding transcriptional LysR family regulator